MAITRARLEDLAPDQAALNAAAGLLKPAKWPLLARNAEGDLIWGECQGSGSNPYRVSADLSDLGSKCTCPSRKFPCKHALALLWLWADAPSGFVSAGVPEWVADWLGRRRKAAAGAAAVPPAGGASLAAALAAEPETPTDPRAEQRKAAAAQRRAADTLFAVRSACDELDTWIADQLRTGLSGLLADLPGRCRRIAARLVDGKAAGLASRLDELPARLMPLPAEERAERAMAELAKLILLVRAWRAAPTDPELKREVVAAESREEVLTGAETVTASGTWEVAGERIATRRDGLVAHASWLMRLDGDDAPPFALLLDYYPASAGRRTGAFAPAERFAAEIAFYPAAAPLRALVAKRDPAAPKETPWPPASNGDPLAAYLERLARAPWIQVAPLRLPAGRIGRDGSGRAWWQDEAGAATLPLAGTPGSLVLGARLETSVALWDGARLDLLCAQSEWGRVAING